MVRRGLPERGPQPAEVGIGGRSGEGDDNLRAPRGAQITELERSFFCTVESKIPYHRIRRILLDGKTLYDSCLRKGE
jgi:uncharacterized protein (UPF0248 family)